MSKRVLVVGGVAGGASAAARIRRIDELADITVFERGPHVSFSNCCLPYYLNRNIPESENLILMSPEVFKTQYNIDVRTGSEVVEIDRAAKKVKVKTVRGQEYEEAYDVLILSPGGNAIMPKSIEGISKENVFGVRNVVDIRAIDDYIQEHKCENIAVIGGGFIGCEVAECLHEAGKKVTLVEMSNQVMPPLDFDMAQILHKEMLDKGLGLVLGDGIKAIRDGEVELQSGRIVPADAVIMAIGVTPETDLVDKAGLEVGVTGGIKVDHNYRTTKDKNIYAIGDAIESYNMLTRKPMHLALAWPAQMQARAAADAIYGMEVDNPGYLGSSVVRIFDIYGASTGLNEKACKAAGIDYDFAYVIPMDKVGLMPGSEPIYVKVLFEVPTGKILGGQAAGKNNPDRRIDVIASVIHFGGTLNDLKNMELCYAPVVGTAKDAVNMAGLVGLNLLNQKFNQVHVDEVRGLVEKDAFIVDVREKDEYEQGHLINAINIPMSEIRDRLDEIPNDKPVYVHCRSAQRSYNVCRALQGHGFNNIINISGSYLGICMFEYAQDVLEDRKPIVTKYNFN